MISKRYPKPTGIEGSWPGGCFSFGCSYFYVVLIPFVFWLALARFLALFHFIQLLSWVSFLIFLLLLTLGLCFLWFKDFFFFLPLTFLTWLCQKVLVEMAISLRIPPYLLLLFYFNWVDGLGNCLHIIYLS